MAEDNKKVLLIDDNPTLATTLQMILEIKGFTIITASDGITGLKKVTEEMPDIIILDIMLPGMDGYEVCEKVKTNPDTKNIPVIMLTGKDTGNDFDMALKKKADWYIIKPYNIDHLLSVFDKLLKSKGK